MTNYEIPDTGGEGDIAPLVPDAEKQAALTAEGWWLVRWVSDGKDRLVKGEIIQEGSTVENVLRAGEKFTPGPSPIDGGWRRISGERGMRLTVLRPIDPLTDPAGYVEFEMADLSIVGSGVTIRSEAAETTDRVRIDVHENGTCHVSGAIGNAPFNVDNPNPETSFADFDAAQLLLTEAKDGLDFIAPGLTSTAATVPQSF